MCRVGSPGLTGTDAQRGVAAGVPPPPAPRTQLASAAAVARWLPRQPRSGQLDNHLLPSAAAAGSSPAVVSSPPSPASLTPEKLRSF